ncbi:hypothetical protein RI129_002890 [Pyrocoelia pectoralis]|uniref:Uncharacterized protein n=1 Tax=Pyrocoelia pectoralis TaxID=417401 RepID=A0AAN7VPI0_9COLE
MYKFSHECVEHVPCRNYQGHLRSNKHKTKACINICDGVPLIRGAFKNKLTSYRCTPAGTHIDVFQFMNELKEKIKYIINYQLKQHNPLKINCELFGVYFLDTKEVADIKSFITKYEIITIANSIEDYIENVTNILDKKNSEIQQKDSGAMDFGKFVICTSNPLKASSNIPLPPCIDTKRGVLNIENRDNWYFGWCLVAALYQPDGLLWTPSSYPHFNTVFKWEGIEFPVHIKNICKFEENNENVSINVYGLESVFSDDKRKVEVVGPLYFSKFKRLVHVNLLYINDDRGNQHYCLRLFTLSKRSIK